MDSRRSMLGKAAAAAAGAFALSQADASQIGGGSIPPLRGLASDTPFLFSYLWTSLAGFTIAEWTNPQSYPLEIVGCYLWTGIDQGPRGSLSADGHAGAPAYNPSVCDSHMELRKDHGTTGTLLGWNQWDHYEEPLAPNHGNLFWYPQGYCVRLAVGAKLYLRYLTAVIGGYPSAGKNATHCVTIWWRDPSG